MAIREGHARGERDHVGVLTAGLLAEDGGYVVEERGAEEVVGVEEIDVGCIDLCQTCIARRRGSGFLLLQQVYVKIGRTVLFGKLAAEGGRGVRGVIVDKKNPQRTVGQLAEGIERGRQKLRTVEIGDDYGEERAGHFGRASVSREYFLGRFSTENAPFARPKRGRRMWGIVIALRGYSGCRQAYPAGSCSISSRCIRDAGDAPDGRNTGSAGRPPAFRG